MNKNQSVSQQEVQQQAREAALAAAVVAPQEPTSLVSFTSRGSLLILGEGDGVLTVLRTLHGTMPRLSVVGIEQLPPNESFPEVTVYPGRVARLNGHLGHWEPEWDVDPAGVASAEKVGPFDLVLDLSPEPLIHRSMLPFGYFAPRDADELQQALAALPELVGEFEKPKFFNYDASRCAHSRSGLTACTRCIDACPAQAITSNAGQISVNPNLCQGGGTCASTCPSGAISYAYPGLGDTLGQLRDMLGAFFNAGGERPALLIHDVSAGHLAVTPEPRVLPFRVEEVGSVGMDTWLASLAYGAEQILILTTDTTPAETIALLDEQIGHAQQILTALGYGRRIQRVDSASLPLAVSSTTDSTNAPARFLLLGDKRQVLRMALDHLQAQAPSAAATVELPDGAPFGAVQVDTEKCTLCLACVSVCPAGALMDGGDRPELAFLEQSCVQCGLCRQACPEQAVTLLPRYQFDPSARQRQVLHEETPLQCTGCGKPFATASVIKRITGMLAAHPMFQDEAARRRLAMCEDCRVRDLLRDELERTQ